jgi:outer membrane protein OmpA-like peptidoglycan-associated protein
MRQFSSITWGAVFFVACGGTPPAESPADDTETYADTGGSSSPDSGEAGAEPGSGSNGENTFQLKNSDSAGDARGVSESKIKPTATEAAMRFFIVDREKEEPISGIVISLTSPEGEKYYTEETDAKGYAEVLVPAGKEYELVYLSLGRRKINAKVPVKDLPNQNVKLTLRYKGWKPKPRPDAAGKPLKQPGFVLKGVQFDTGKATIRPDSLARLDSVLEYMTHKKSARIEVSGHTDNVGQAARNKALSEKRAKAVRAYLIEKGITGDRIEAVGYGDAQPVASNDTEEGRQENRRIEAKEL